MPDAQLIVFGSDVLANPGVSTTSGAGTQGQGTATVQSGQRVFEDDDIIVFDIIRADGMGELTSASALEDITVYDSYDDFLNGIVKFNYAPQNPNQTAPLQSDLSGHGDGYARFVSTNILLPDNSPGAPTFNQLFIAPGTGIAETVGDNGGQASFDRMQDFDFNGDGDFNDPRESGNNRLLATDYATPAICFAGGTRILTPRGARPIEQLEIGDRIWTMDSGFQSIRWVGTRRLPASGKFAPVRFETGAIGNTRPLEVSQNHRMLRSGAAIELLFGTSEVLVPAKFLVNGSSIALRETGWVDYVHILFDQHEVVMANGALSESLRPGRGTGHEAASAVELLEIFPDLADAGEKNDTGPADIARRSLRRYEAGLLDD